MREKNGGHIEVEAAIRTCGGERGSPRRKKNPRRENVTRGKTPSPSSSEESHEGRHSREEDELPKRLCLYPFHRANTKSGAVKGKSIKGKQQSAASLDRFGYNHAAGTCHKCAMGRELQGGKTEKKEGRGKGKKTTKSDLEGARIKRDGAVKNPQDTNYTELWSIQEHRGREKAKSRSARDERRRYRFAMINQTQNYEGTMQPRLL